MEIEMALTLTERVRQLLASLTIFLAILGTPNSSAQSQPSPPTPTETSQAPQSESRGADQPATENEGDAEARRSIDKPAPTPKSETHPAEERETRDEEATTDWWSTIFSGSVALFTIVLAGSTIGLWISTHRISRHSIVSERAWVKMSHRSGGEFGNGLEIDRERNEIRIVIQVKNYGRTPADVSNVFLDWRALPKGQSLPDSPNYLPTEYALLSISAFLVANDEVLSWITFRGISGDHLDKIGTGDETLWIYGYVDYTDAFGQRHRAGYARQYVPGRTGNSLIVVTHSAYNYDRPRQ